MSKFVFGACVVWLSTCAVPTAYGEDLARFRISVKGSWEPVSLECEEGCAWKALTFRLNSQGTLIDEFGMAGSETRAGQRRFLIRVGSVGDRMALTCETGCAWKALEFTRAPTPAVITERGKVQAAADARAEYALTPADIRLAIDIGRDPDAAQHFLAQYRIVGYQPVYGVPTAPNKTPTFGVFSTPFSRVVIASCEARQAGKPFSGHDVTAEMLEPELRVLAFRWNSRVSHPIWCVNLSPHRIGQLDATSVPPVQHVTDVVILPTAEKGAAPILPTRSERVRSRDLGLAEHIWYGGGVRATFRLADLPDRPILKLSISPNYGGRVEPWGNNDGRFPIDLARLR
jgi:hypothetical protein